MRDGSSEGSERLADAMGDVMPGYSLATPRVRKVYTQFSCDSIQKTGTLWKRFTRHATRRNNIVHKGLTATPEEASDSIAVVEEVTRHME